MARAAEGAEGSEGAGMAAVAMAEEEEEGSVAEGAADSAVEGWEGEGTADSEGPAATAAALWFAMRWAVGGQGLPEPYAVALGTVPWMNGMLAMESVMVRCPLITTPCCVKARNSPVRSMQSESSSTKPSKCAGFLSQVTGSLSELVKTNVSEACSLEELLSWEDIGVCVLALPKWIGSLKASSRSRSALHMRARERARGR